MAKGRRRQRLKGPNDARRIVRALGEFFFHSSCFYILTTVIYILMAICDREGNRYETDPNEVQGSLGKVLETKRAQMTCLVSFGLLGEFSSFFFVLF